MNSFIHVNHIKAKINYQKYFTDYDIFEIQTSAKYFEDGSYILDRPMLCGNVCSIFFERGTKFYVLMDKGRENKNSLKQILWDSEEGDDITINLVHPSNVEDNILIQLLLNSLSTYKSKGLKASNLTGHFYCYHSKWLEKKKIKGSNEIIKIPCLEIKITNDLKLIMNVRTFTSELLKSHIKFNNKKFDQYPKYIFSANSSLRRKLTDDKDRAYILRQTLGDKSEIPFFDIHSKEKYDSTKIGVLTSVIHLFNNRYKDICNIEFSSITDYYCLDTKHTLKENKKVINDYLLSEKINIFDMIKSSRSEYLCSKIYNLLKDNYKCDIVTNDFLDKERLNICCIHNNQYYEEQNDPHLTFKEGYVLQHITLEDFYGKDKFALSTVVNELLIKNDIKNKKITLYDWSKLGFKEDISFGFRYVREKQECFCFMTINKEGQFSFQDLEYDLLESNDYSTCLEIFVEHPEVRGVIKNKKGDINIICETNLFTIPEIEDISAELQRNNTYLRGKEKRDTLLTSLLDIKSFKHGNAQYYFVGTIGYGMKQTINNAVNIRKIEPYENSLLLFDKVIPLLNVTFVHNGQLTVIPFPFKYIREYLKTKE